MCPSVAVPSRLEVHTLLAATYKEAGSQVLGFALLVGFYFGPATMRGGVLGNVRNGAFF